MAKTPLQRKHHRLPINGKKFSRIINSCLRALMRSKRKLNLCAFATLKPDNLHEKTPSFLINARPGSGTSRWFFPVSSLHSGGRREKSFERRRSRSKTRRSSRDSKGIK